MPEHDPAPTPPSTLTCACCGGTEAGPRALLAWTTAVERGRPQRFCATCSRAHLRSMEARLDPEHW